MDKKRLRMFAGPNGSGKSTLKLQIEEEVSGQKLFRNYINPDEIEAGIRSSQILDLGSYGVTSTIDEVLDFFVNSPFLQQVHLSEQAQRLNYADGKLLFHHVDMNSYFASVAADFIRQKLLVLGESFTFETVMSSPDKVEFFCKAKALGYRTYLYYIATDDPLINISRVEQRAASGGHSVPKEKTIARYERSLSLLMPAIRCSDRAYIFDNSRHATISWIAEIVDGKILEPRTNEFPAWFKKVLGDKGNAF
jgi:predicted ABC-type ATPase